MSGGARRAFLAGAASAAIALQSSGPARGQPLTLTLGTATPGGGFPVYGAAFVEGLRRADPDLLIEPINTRGSAENVPRLEAGTLDLALVQGEVVHESLSGMGRPPARLDIVTAMYPTAGLFVVRADSAVRTISDLRGQPIAWGAQGSASMRRATSSRSTSSAPATGRRWCSTGGSRPCGAAVPVGQAS